LEANGCILATAGSLNKIIPDKATARGGHLAFPTPRRVVPRLALPCRENMGLPPLARPGNQMELAHLPNWG
jgi:hypothetical protein